MAKSLYTISQHARVIILDAGTLPINVIKWLEYKKFFNCSEISFYQKLFHTIGYKCKLEIEYVAELIDATGSLVFAATAPDEKKARQMLFHIIPINYTNSLKNPQFSKDAKDLLARYEADKEF